MDKLKQGMILAGLALLLLALACVMEAGIRSESRKWYGILFASDYFPPLNGFPTTDDADERILICSHLLAAYPFKQSSLHPTCHNVYCVAGSLHTEVTVFEVWDLSEQERIIRAAKAIRSKFGTRRFSIEFYGTETGPAPTDQFLRKVRID